MPVMFSCRNALMRATQRRTSRKVAREPRRNQLVTMKKSGITAKVTRVMNTWGAPLWRRKSVRRCLSSIAPLPGQEC